MNTICLLYFVLIKSKGDARNIMAKRAGYKKTLYFGKKGRCVRWQLL